MHTNRRKAKIFITVASETWATIIYSSGKTRLNYKKVLFKDETIKTYN